MVIEKPRVLGVGFNEKLKTLAIRHLYGQAILDWMSRIGADVTVPLCVYDLVILNGDTENAEDIIASAYSYGLGEQNIVVVTNHRTERLFKDRGVTTVSVLDFPKGIERLV